MLLIGFDLIFGSDDDSNGSQDAQFSIQSKQRHTDMPDVASFMYANKFQNAWEHRGEKSLKDHNIQMLAQVNF